MIDLVWKLAHRVRDVEDRAAKAEAAARDLARWLAEIARHRSVERNPDGEDQAADSMRLIARDALARHPDYAPESREAAQAKETR